MNLIFKITLFLFIYTSVVAQINYGKITYERKTNLYKKFKGDDVKEWLKAEDKNKVDVFELYFNDTLSLFKPEDSDIKEKMEWATSKNTVYQNTPENKRLIKKSIWGEDFILTDSLKTIAWKITDNKRKIQGYNCRKAIWNANDSTRIYAWYCDEIIPSVGPESFRGLPGAILGLATEDGGVIYFAKKIEVIQANITEIQPFKKVKKIYTSNELRTKLEKELGKEKWGKRLIENVFGIW